MPEDSALTPVEPVQWDAPAALQLAGSVPGVRRVHADLVVAWPVETSEGRRVAYMAQHGESRNLAEVGASVLEVVGWVAHRVRALDPETGGERTYWRAVLIGSDLGFAASCSAGVVRSLCDLVAMLGPPPWQPPLRLRVLKGKGAGGRPWHTLEWLGDSK